MQVRELISDNDFQQRRRLLEGRGLSVPSCNRAWGAFVGARLLGTVGAQGETLVGFAVVEGAEGQGLAVTLTQRAVSDLFIAGVRKFVPSPNPPKPQSLKPSVFIRQPAHRRPFSWNGMMVFLNTFVSLKA